MVGIESLKVVELKKKKKIKLKKFEPFNKVLSGISIPNDT